MIQYLENLLHAMRPAFSRTATFRWFVVVCVGFVVRTDTFGVSSIVRALSLPPESYLGLLHFFHSTAWTVEGLLALWWRRLLEEDLGYRVGDRLVLVADHTKIPKDGRKMPAVTTLHQDSETASKPGFFRGHHWGCVSLLISSGNQYCAAPLWAAIHQGLEQVGGRDTPSGTLSTRIVTMARTIAHTLHRKAYLVLDAFFAVGPVFQEASNELQGESNVIHILTRAKKNIVAYLPCTRTRKPSRGRPRKYGKKLRLMQLFDSASRLAQFHSAETSVYEKKETIRYLTLTLLWKPTKGLIRFFLFETSRGRMILMTSDLTLDPLVALHLYCRRVTIETMFDMLKNILGGMAYHFWSKFLKPTSRRPTRNDRPLPTSSRPKQTRNTFTAIEKFVNVQLLVLGFLQVLAVRFPLHIWSQSRCWLRTYSSDTPSPFVTRTALANVIRGNLHAFRKNRITQLILDKQDSSMNPALQRKVG